MEEGDDRSIKLGQSSRCWPARQSLSAPCHTERACCVWLVFYAVVQMQQLKASFFGGLDDQGGGVLTGWEGL